MKASEFVKVGNDIPVYAAKCVAVGKIPEWVSLWTTVKKGDVFLLLKDDSRPYLLGGGFVDIPKSNLKFVEYVQVEQNLIDGSWRIKDVK